jgi:hypothetical protein
VRGDADNRLGGDTPSQSCRFAVPRDAGHTGTIEGSIEQGAQQNLRGDAAVGIGHDAARLGQVRTKHDCKSENHR